SKSSWFCSAGRTDAPPTGADLDPSLEDFPWCAIFFPLRDQQAPPRGSPRGRGALEGTAGRGTNLPQYTFPAASEQFLPPWPGTSLTGILTSLRAHRVALTETRSRVVFDYNADPEMCNASTALLRAATAG